MAVDQPKPALDNKNQIKVKSGVTIDITAKQFSGVLRSVKFRDEKSHFSVLTVSGVSCAGVCHEVNIGANYTFVGAFEEQKKYNDWSFKFKSYDVSIDSTIGIRELLISEAKWLGPALATRLVTRYQKETLKVIEERPEEVAEFLGINPAKAREVQQWARGQAANLELKQKLYKIGITTSQVSKMISEYGADAELKIKKDCFSLTKVKGFGFKTVDSIAALIGVPQTDPGRIKAAVKFAIETLYNEGHTCIPCTEVIRFASSLTGLMQDKIIPHIEQLVLDAEVITDKEDWDKYAKKHSITLE